MKITAIRTVVLGTKIAQPISTSFGTMTHRYMILVNIQTNEGVEGWGESWSNFPAWSPQERIHTINDGLVPLLIGEDPRDVSVLHRKMRSATRILEKQWGAPGPIAQAISALDIALWDIAAKIQNKPLYKLWEASQTRIPVYATALGPKDPTKLIEKMQARGVKAFKLKLGFGEKLDSYNLDLVRDLIGAEAKLMVDANQAWDVETTRKMAKLLERYSVSWLEEPLAADDWQGMAQLQKELPFPVAAGENIFSASRFKELLNANAIGIAQPDVCKLGGLTEMRDVALTVREKDIPYAPHYLGGTVGLMASLHFFAGTTGGLIMELDPHDYPLRDDIAADTLIVEDGCINLGQAPGLGIEPSEKVIRKYFIDEKITRA